MPTRRARALGLTVLLSGMPQACVSEEACVDDSNCRSGLTCVDGVCEEQCSGEGCTPSDNVCTPDGPAEQCDDQLTCTIDTCSASGACSHEIASADVVCAPAHDECDIADLCTGASEACPANAVLADGSSCSVGQCLAGVCTPADIDALIWYLKLDEPSGDIAYDTSPTHRDGTIVGGVRRSGQVRGALELSGADSFVVADDIQYAGSGTVALWFSTTQAPPGPGTAVIYSHGGTGPSNLAIYLDTGGNLAARIRGASGSDTVRALGPVRDGQWHHVAFVFADEAIPRIYLDGALNKAGVAAVSGVDPTGRIVLGGSSGSLISDFFAGAVDDVRVYAKALTSGEVLDAYRAQNGVTPITLFPEADTFVTGGTLANDNFSSDYKLLVKEADDPSFTRYSFLRFEVAGLADVASATLSLTVSSNGLVDAGAIQHTLYAVAADGWDEYTMTWNTQPAIGAAITTFSVPAVDGVVQLDLTQAVRTAATDNQRLSLAIRAVDDFGSQGFASYATRETPLPPRLTVDW